jgi:cell division protein FtsI/penicillin-binding protein 2
LSESVDSTSSPNANNTNIIIGAVVSAVAVLVTVIFIVAYIIHRKMSKKENVQDNTYDNPEPNRRGSLQPEYGEKAEYAQLNSLTRVSIDANYQSLLKKDQLQLH